MSDIPEIVGQLKQATDFQINQTILREKIQTDLHFTHDGGLFKATPELIAFVHAWRSADEVWPWGGGDSMFMEDTYGNPIHIENCAEFYSTASQHYQKIMNTWHQQSAELKRVRKV
jgi:hypothetical protein